MCGARTVNGEDTVTRMDGSAWDLRGEAVNAVHDASLASGANGGALVKLNAHGAGRKRDAESPLRAAFEG